MGANRQRQRMPEQEESMSSHGQRRACGRAGVRGFFLSAVVFPRRKVRAGRAARLDLTREEPLARVDAIARIDRLGAVPTHYRT